MTAPRPAPPGLLSSPEPLSTVYDVALLDLDGVVYLGGTAIASAAPAPDAFGYSLAVGECTVGIMTRSAAY